MQPHKPMKRIFYDYQIFLQQQYGGISRYFYELAQRINGLDGFTAQIFAPLHANAYLAAGKGTAIGFHVRKTPKVWRFYEALDIALSQVCFAVGKPTIVHETYYRSRGLAPKTCPIVVTVYDMIHEKFRDLFKESDKTTILKRKAVDRADRIICISEHTRRDLIDLFDVPEEKTVAVPLGFGLERSVDRSSGPANRDGVPYLLYVGSRDFHKNFEGFLRAFAASPVLRDNFSIEAFGGPPLSASEYELMGRLNISRSKVVWRHGSDGLLSQLYRGAAAFIYPSLYEGFGIPPLEAMSLDCPVVCSNTSSIPEAVGDAAVMFDPLDTESMKSAIESVVMSESTQASLIARGRLRIERFSWDRCATATSAVYSELLN